MKLTGSIGLSAALHAGALCTVFAIAATVVDPEPEPVFIEDVRPIVFQTIALPVEPVEEEPVAMTEEDGNLEEPEELTPPPKPRKIEKPKPDLPAAPEVAEVEPKPEPEPKPDPVEKVASVVVDRAEDSTESKEVEVATAEAPVARDVSSAEVAAATAGARPTSEQTYASGAPVGSKRADGGSGLGGGIDRKGAMRAHRKAIYRVVNARKTYPLVARRGRMQGLVTLAVTVAADGEILKVRVLKTSGHKVLDEHALHTVRSTKMLPPRPAGLQWKQYTYKIPMRFKM